MKATIDQSLSFAALTCLRCGYSLAGLSEPRCPECGERYDPQLARRRKRNRVLVAIIVMLIVIYAPYSWIPFSSGNPSYVRTWLGLWPLLPGLPLSMIITALLFRSAHPLQVVFMVATAIFFVGGMLWLGSRGRWRRLIFWAFVALTLSCLNSWICRNIFLA